MKRSVIFAGLLLSQSLFGGEETHALWMELSAKCQNVARGLAGIGPHTSPDEMGFTPDLIAIDVLLDKLVEEKELVRIEMQLKNPSDWEGDVGPKLLELVKVLSEKYGFYVASEMMDLGFRLELNPIEDGKPLPMNLRVPSETGKKFQEFVKESGLLAETE